MRRKLFYVLLVTGAVHHAKSQNSQPVNLDVFPPTPNAAALMKFSDIPVNLATGIPQVSVPIYSYKGNNGLSFSVSLSYHAGGTKVEEVSSDIGIGWALEAGGQVARTVRGLQDDHPTLGYFNLGHLSESSEYIVQHHNHISTDNDSLELIYKNLLDTQNDIFSYSINGKSGKFVYGLDGSYVAVPQTKVKIQRIINTGSSLYRSLDGFIITDIDGTKYYFTLSDNVYAQLMGNITPGSFSYASCWNLTKVVAPYNTDSITITYEQYSLSYLQGIVQSWYVVKPTTNRVPALDYYQTNEYNAVANRIKQINFPDSTKVIFNYEQTDRKDIETSGALKEIIVSNKGNSYGYHLWHSYGTNGAYEPAPSNVSSTLRLQLDSVAQFAGSSFLPPYRFTYNGTLPDRLSLAQDFWGYANGYSASTLVPVYYTGLTTKLDGADRRPDSVYVKQGSLTSMQYPDGGTTSFEYEVHQAGDGKLTQSIPNTVTVLGGASFALDGYKNFTVNRADSSSSIALRFTLNSWCLDMSTSCTFVFKVKSMDGTTTYASVNFTHSEIGSSHTKTVNLSSFPNGDYKLTYEFTTSCTCEETFNMTLKWDQYTVDSSQLVGGLRIKKITTDDGINHAHDMVKEYYYQKVNGTSSGTIWLKPRFNYDYYTITGGEGQINTQYLVRSSAANYPVTYINGAPIMYSRVIEKQRSDSGYNGQTIYTFSDFNLVGPPCSDGAGGNCFPFAIQMPLDYGLGQLRTQEVYDSSNHILKRVENTYNYIETDPPNVDNFRSIKFGQATKNYYNETQSVYVAGEYFPVTGRNEKIKETVTEYSSSNDSAVKETNYVYDTAYYNLQSSYTYNSKSQKVEQRLYYPYNYTISGAIGAMRDSGIIEPVIATEGWLTDTSSNTSRMVNGSIASYASSNNIIRPSVFYTLHNAGPLPAGTIGSFDPATLNRNTAYFKPEITYDAYDTKGNLLQYTNKSSTGSIIWDNNKQYAIAKIENAFNAACAYTSFESDGTGNWPVPSSARDTLNAITGKKSYNLASGSIIFPLYSLNASIKYIVSYWSRNGQYSVSQTVSSRTGKTVNGWTYYEHTLFLSSLGTFNISGSGLIDELRLYPVGAQMTSFVYDPLTGLTSTEDPAGIITYYEYDNFYRLKNIKDYAGNIIKNFRYNYANSCGDNCFVLQMQTLNGSNTIGYPVGVFNVNGRLLGNAADKNEYVTLWNADSANQQIGTLSATGDSLKFNLAVNTGKEPPPGVTGCRYYQFDIACNSFDGVRNVNGSFVDFGDGATMKLGNTRLDTAVTLAANTSKYLYTGSKDVYFVHSYADSSQHTITIYHNDGDGYAWLDNRLASVTSLQRIRNMRGHYPQYMTTLGYSSYADSTAYSLPDNWNSINSVLVWDVNMGDGVTVCTNMRCPQDFMQYNRDLETITTSHYGIYNACYRDTSFRLSRLKSNWNTWFTHLQTLVISDEHWDREDLSALTELKNFYLHAGNELHSNDATDNAPVPIPSAVIDNIINQIAAGSGQSVTNGVIRMNTGSTARTSASDTAVTFLKSKGWTIIINEVTQ